jgi:signal transduction histidine kinase
LSLFLMTQVVFNLLSNAVKYAFEDPRRFQVRISARETATNYEIDFSNYGDRIPPDMIEAIFLEGVRTKEGEQQNVMGDGLGLWVAKRVMIAHFGDIRVTSCHAPTTFTVFLPKWLKNRKILKYE